MEAACVGLSVEHMNMILTQLMRQKGFEGKATLEVLNRLPGRTLRRDALKSMLLSWYEASPKEEKACLLQKVRELERSFFCEVNGLRMHVIDHQGKARQACIAPHGFALNAS